MNKLKIKNYNESCGFIPKEIREDDSAVICGGFPLHLISDQLFSKNPLSWKLWYSDIDVFKLGKYNSKLLDDFENCTKGFELEEKEYNMKFERTSYLANTLSFSSESNMRFEKFQFIKKEYDSLDSLFDQFDLINCQVAIKGEYFLFTDDFYKSCFEDHIVKQNKVPNLTSFSSRLYYGNRYVKYIRKQSKIISMINSNSDILDSGHYSRLKDVSVSDDLNKFLFDLHVECELKDEKDIEKDDEIYVDIYGRKNVTRSVLHRMFIKYCDSFGEYCNTKTFDKEDCLYFIRSKFSNKKANSEHILKTSKGEV